MVSTTVFTSAPRTLKPTTILRFPFSREICIGPSSYFTSAICSKGIWLPDGKVTNRAFRFSISFRLSLSNRTTKSKRFSPSYTTPAVSPAKPIRTTLFKSPIFKPYNANLSLLYLIVICGKPATRSALASETPSIPLINCTTSSPLLTNISISSPKILTATSLLTPVINSLKRIWIGWENSVNAPGISDKACSIFSISSSFVSAEVHSLLSFKRIIISPASIGIGSVGISAEPILVTIIFTSGNLSLNIFSACVVASTSWDNELPDAMIKCVAISPSSNVGMNSPPNELKTNKLATNKPMATAIIAALTCSAFSKIGV